MLPSTNNLVVPKGRLFIDLFDDDGNPQGERYLGKTSGFELAVESESLEYIDAESGLNEKYEEITLSVTRTFTTTVNNINPANEALFLIADVAQDSTSAASITDEAINAVKTGHWYQIGQDATHPTGVRAIENVVVEDDGATGFTVTDDYVLDLDLGRIYIVPGGAITDGTNLLIDYDTTAVNWDQLSTSEVAQSNAALRFIADNPKGDNSDVYVPKAAVRPSGTRSYKSQEAAWAEMQLEIEVLKPDTGASLYTDGRAVAVA